MWWLLIGEMLSQVEAELDGFQVCIHLEQCKSRYLMTLTPNVRCNHNLVVSGSL